MTALAGPKVIYVASWDKLPSDVEQPGKGGAEAVAVRDPDRIYILGSRSSSDNIYLSEHERYHLRKRHSGRPQTPEKRISQERDAMLHTYRTLGRPKNIRGDIRGLATDLHDIHGMPLDDGLALIKRVFAQGKNVPPHWTSSINYVVDEVRALPSAPSRSENSITEAMGEKGTPSLSESIDRGKEVESKPAETTVRKHPRRKPKGGDTVVRKHRRRTPKRRR